MRTLATSPTPVSPNASSVVPWQPLARRDQLVLTEVDGEVLIYDQASQHIHHLNPTAAVLWRLCDGQRTVDDLRRAVCVERGEDLSDDGVRRALTKLAAARLLDDVPDPALIRTGPSRRTLLTRAAVAGAGAMLVSVTAPTAAAAVSLSCVGVTQDTCFLGGSRFSPTGTPCCNAQGVLGTCQPFGSGTFCTGAPA